MNIDRPSIVWITGASRGIGRALSLAFTARGWMVAGCARNADELHETARLSRGTGLFIPFILDVTDAEAVRSIVARIEAEFGPIDLAILNAGTHRPVAADSFDLTAIRTLVDTNLMGTAACLAAILPVLTARRRGEVAVVASMTGYVGLPTAAGYGATKAGLISMCEALKPDLEQHGVSIRVINPGFVDTPLTRKNSFPMPFLITPERAAQLILKGLGRRRFEIALPKAMAVTMKLLRLLPYPLLFMVTRRITPGPGETAGEG